MAIKNPTAQPGVILAGGRNMESFSKYLNTVAGIVEHEKERRALEKKELDKSLIPMEADLNEVLADDIPNILGQINDELNLRVDYRGQGINASDPMNKEAYSKSKAMQNAVTTNITYAKQHAELVKQARNIMADASKEDDIDLEETMTRTALAIAEKDILKREQMIKDEFGGSLVAFNEFNPIAYQTKVLKNYSTSDLGIAESANAPKGFDVLETTVGYTEPQLATISADLLSNKQFRAAKEAKFDVLSTAKQSEYEEKVANGAYGSALEAFTAEGVSLISTKKKLTGSREPKASVTNVNINQETEPTITDPLLHRVGAMVSGDPQYVKKVNVPGLGDVSMIEFPTVKIGTFKKKIPLFNDDGTPKMRKNTKGEETGEQEYEMKVVDEVIESMYEVGGQWYISTNKSKAYNQGMRAPNSMDYGVPITDPWDVYQYIAEFNGSHNINNAIKQLKAKGAWDEKKARPDWTKLYSPDNVDYEKEVGF